ncbi:MAG: rRNA pseudouridine synthase [Evtepia sp.]|nr:rRNA pseudouridine synthase [Evtepia sp.]
MERLDKLLSSTGRWSRKEVHALLKAGRATVDGICVKDPAGKYGPESELCVDGQRINRESFVYLMLNKPSGLISSTEDPREETVLDLLPAQYKKMGLFPVGRLDKDTEGLLLLTNDGPLAHHLLSPRHHIEKVYFVKVGGELTVADVLAFSGGITLKDGTLCQKAGLKILEPPDTGLVSLQEGKYHQVKRMMATRGKPVLYLKRLKMGSVELDPMLRTGQWRPLTEEEKMRLTGTGR